MTIATRILQRYVGRAVRSEYDAWRRSGRPAAEYVQVRAPFVVDALSPTGTVGALFASFTDGPERSSNTTGASNPTEAARNLRAAADAAVLEVERLESASPEPVDTDEVLENLRLELEQKVIDLTEKARIEADGRVALARQRLGEIESQAALHVDEVQRRAQATANTISADALARIANGDSNRQAEIDRARKSARAAEKRAERAEQKARRESEEVGEPIETSSEASTFASLRDVVLRASGRAVDDAQAERGARAGLDLSELESLDRSELYALAREHSIRGRSQMSGAQLIEALQQSTQAT